MDETTEISSSLEAVKIFKTQISECLPLLGLMNTADKEDVWKFWKTISAAVKIAVNGKGNISPAPRRQHKRSFLAMDMDVEESHLQQLDQNAISIYIPLKSTASDKLRYRVLKFADQKKIGDYFEEVWQLDTNDKKVQEPCNQNDASVTNSLHTTDRDICIEGPQPSISDLITANTKDATDQRGLKTVAKYLESVSSPKSDNKPVSREEVGASSQLNSKKTPQVATKKIWPVGRPATRSTSSSVKQFPVTEKNKIPLNTLPTSSDRSSTTPSIAEKTEESITFYSDLKTEGSNIDTEENFKVTIFPLGNSLLQIRQDITSEPVSTEFNENQVAIPVKQVPGEASLGTLEQRKSATQPVHEVPVNSTPEVANTEDDVNIDITHLKGNEPFSTSAAAEQLMGPPSQPRNASDIETIISALEEELKKSGTNLTSISVSPLPQPDHSANSTASKVGKAVDTQEGSNVGSPAPQTISTSDMDNMQSSYLNLKATEAQSTDVRRTSVPDDGQHLHTAYVEEPDQSTSHSVGNPGEMMTQFVDKSGHPIKIQAAPVRVATYVDESGQPIRATSGQATAYVSGSGQAVQILQGQEIVEVEGSIDNIIWACDGEMQILQQQQQQEQQMSEATTQLEGIKADQIVHSEAESQPVQAHYDVVEYEVLSDRRLKRGRKKKVRAEGDERVGAENVAGGNSEVLDRTCPICHRVLNYVSSMKAHMRIHTGARPYSCGQCDRKFTTKANRDRHEATHVGLKPFKCDECHKSFTEKRSLKIHMRSHTGERPYVCETCGQGFAQNCTLQVHKVRHTDRRAHLCDLCGKAFRQKNQLEVHVKRHNRQANFPCSQCDTRCYTKGDLLRHMIKHTGERPFSCQLCPRAFTRKQYLIDHENQHYDRKPYRCSQCGMAFHDMGSCHRHLRKHKQTAKDENAAATVLAAGRAARKLPVLNTDAVQEMLGNAKPGQVLKLEDGTDAVVKQVTTDADGSTVYHITCLSIFHDSISNNNGSDDSLQQQQHQQLQHQAIAQEISEAHDGEAEVKVEGSKIMEDESRDDSVECSDHSAGEFPVICVGEGNRLSDGNSFPINIDS